MRRLPHWTLIIALLLAPVAVQAGTPTPAPKVQLKTQTALTYKGTKGVWFPLPAARALLKDVYLLNQARAELESTRRLLQLAEHRVKLTEIEVQASTKIAETWKTVADQQAKALAKKTAWYNSRPFWFAVGFVAATATAISGAYLVHSLR